jgi:predicted ATP-dependent endonuclease of OLD family
MRISEFSAKNFRAFRIINTVRFGNLTTIVGQNDTGKSSILYALDVFFNEQKIEETDFHDKAPVDEFLEITVSFIDLPTEIELEEGVKTNFKEENLLNKDGELEITKVFSRKNPKKPKVFLMVLDYKENKFNNLCSLKEEQLNILGDELGLAMSKSGRSITNKSKRSQLRSYADQKKIEKVCTKIEISEDLAKTIHSYFPVFELFRAETRLGIEETSFQSEFKQIVVDTVEALTHKSEFEDKIRDGLCEEFAKIHQKLLQHTDAITTLKPYPKFSWDKLVSFDLKGVDSDGVEAPLSKRGTGMRRMLMVAFFQYLADRRITNREIQLIYAIEEPEAFIYPGLQRELAKSFNELTDRGFQILITSHSPVFAGFSPVEDLVLLKRVGGKAEVIQSPQLNLDDVADALGVEPSDQICGFKACVFVEGDRDILFWENIFNKLKEKNIVPATPNEKGIGFIPYGGSGLKHCIDRKALKNINKRYLVITDSDRKSSTHSVPQSKINWKNRCEAEKGIFFILRKRDIENYLHPKVLKRAGKPDKPFDDFSDMKDLFGENVIRTIEDMTAEEIIEKGEYKDGTSNCNEILEIASAILSLI